MKISIVGTAWPFRGGLSAMNERLGREFVSLGHDVSILTFTTQYPSFLFPGESQFDDRPAPPLRIRRGVSSIDPVSWLRAGASLRAEAPDVIVVKYWMPFMAPCFGTTLRAAKRGHDPFVVSILDNLVPHESRPFDGALTRYFVNAVDGFVTLSREVLEQLDRFDATKPRSFVPHPIYDNFGEPIARAEARRRLGLDENGRYVLFFGFIRDYKGLDLLLHAMADERVRDAGVRAMIAGEYYANEAKYTALMDELDVRDRIDAFTHFIPDEEVGLYFSAADLVVQPYKSATQSGVTQIAYHFEKPMVVTAVGGLPEIVPDGEVGYVVPVDAGALAEAMVRFFEGDPDRFAAAVRRLKQQYSWDALARTILDMPERARSSRS